MKGLEYSKMSPPFHVAALSDEQVPQAFPLIQATWPGTDLTAWQEFVQFFSDRTSTGHAGVLALHDPAGYIGGLLAYRLDQDLRTGPMLAVHLFTALNLMNSPRTVRALLEAAEARAIEMGCKGIQIRLHSEQAWLASRLRTLGLKSEAGLFTKTIDSA